jgi:regulatory protein
MNRKYPPFETLERIKKWCDLQERAHSDVMHKLASWGLDREEAEDIVAELILENYLSEERFARAFARGKSRIKKWGWKKIESELRKKKVSQALIQIAKEEIDEEDYLTGLVNLLEKKKKLVKGINPMDRKNKLLRFALNKGYSYDEIQLALEQID